jgi:hypothetical protein
MEQSNSAIKLDREFIAWVILSVQHWMPRSNRTGEQEVYAIPASASNV